MSTNVNCAGNAEERVETTEQFVELCGRQLQASATNRRMVTHRRRGNVAPLDGIRELES